MSKGNKTYSHGSKKREKHRAEGQREKSIAKSVLEGDEYQKNYNEKYQLEETDEEIIK